MVDAMELAGVTDLRAHVDLPLALRVIGRPGDASLRRAVDSLRAWRRAGGLRKDANRDGVYEHSAAIRLMDAWWPLWVRAQFAPALGGKAYRTLLAAVELDNTPNNHGDHLGSAYQTGWYGFVRKDLRTVLKRKVRGKYSRRYCGGGKIKRCRQVLRRSLRDAIRAARGDIYGGRDVRGGRQARRPVVLRRGPPAPGRRRHAAAHPLDQPADLPAGRRGPGRRAALS